MTLIYCTIIVNQQQIFLGKLCENKYSLSRNALNQMNMSYLLYASVVWDVSNTTIVKNEGDLEHLYRSMDLWNRGGAVEAEKFQSFPIVSWSTFELRARLVP